MRNKVKGFQFKQTLDIIDPVTKVTSQKPMKPFMVNQLTIAFERDMMMLSPFDETLHKQLIDYEVERIGQSGVPVYTSKDEHFVDALGLAYLAFVLEFPDLTNSIKKLTNSSKIEKSPIQLGQARVNATLKNLNTPTSNPWSATRLNKTDPTELPEPGQNWVKVPLGAKPSAKSGFGWGSRMSGRNGNSGGRSLW